MDCTDADSSWKFAKVTMSLRTPRMSTRMSSDSSAWSALSYMCCGGAPPSSESLPIRSVLVRGACDRGARCTLERVRKIRRR